MKEKKKQKKKRNSFISDLKRDKLLYSMLIVMAVTLIVFCYLPMFGLTLAFKDWRIPVTGVRPGGLFGSPWATDENGNLDLLKHFKVLFLNADVRKTFVNTLRIAALRIVFSFPLPIVLALMLNELTDEHFKKFVQSLSYLPYFISWVIISGVLKDMTASESAFQNFIKLIFGTELKFFSDNNLFLTICVVSEIWKNVGWGSIIYFAALTAISPELYEAAMIDGAGRWSKMFYITLPGIMPAVSINLIFSITSITSGGFDQIYNMYNQLVYEKGDILETYIFRTSFGSGGSPESYGVNTALGLFNSLIGLTLMLTANKVVKKLGGEGVW